MTKNARNPGEYYFEKVTSPANNVIDFTLRTSLWNPARGLRLKMRDIAGVEELRDLCESMLATEKLRQIAEAEIKHYLDTEIKPEQELLQKSIDAKRAAIAKELGLDIAAVPSSGGV